MIPEIDYDVDVEIEKEPDLTYKLGKILNIKIDGIEAVKQAIYKILNTQRYKYLIYSFDYGIELDDLIGESIPFVCAELPLRIEEALLQDDRIMEISDFTFKVEGNKVHTEFTVSTIYGDITEELEVNV